jgi:hypothetical protein
MADEFFFNKDGKQYGPVSAGQLKKLADSGRLLPTDHIKKGAMSGWVQASAVKGLFATPFQGAPAADVPESAPVGGAAPTSAADAIPLDDAGDDVLVAEVVEDELLDDTEPEPLKPRRKRSPTSASLVDSLNLLVRNPVQNLGHVYERLGPEHGLTVGIASAGIYVLVFVLWAYFVLPPAVVRNLATAMASKEASVSVSRPSSSKAWDGQEVKVIFKSVLVGLVMPAGAFLGILISRKLLGGRGSLEGDVFLAGTVMLPGALEFLIRAFFALLGVNLLEAYLVITLFDLCLTLLVLYVGCSRISKLSDGACTLALPIILFIPMVILDILARYVLT